MKNKTVKKMLEPAEALKRIKSVATIVAIGPSSSGKSTLIYALVNHKVVKFIRKGIGEKNRTTIIPCNFLFDQRIKEEHFGLKIKLKKFASKDIHIELIEQLAILFNNMFCEADATIDSIDDIWLDRVLEPESAAYHLGELKSVVSISELKEGLMPILTAIENAEVSFRDRVNSRRGELKQQRMNITEINRLVFMEMWDELSDSVTKSYFQWIERIGDNIEKTLIHLFESENMSESMQFSICHKGEYPYGGKILEELFDPYKPYSLLIDEMTLACKPLGDILNEEEEQPLRFCLKDTMGINQISMESKAIKDALDIALSCSPDSILLLISLEERDDTIAESFYAIVYKLKQADKMNIPINVLFTKADKIIDNIIYKNYRVDINVKQVDYNEHIFDAIDKMKGAIKGYLSKFPQESATWLSLRYKDEEIDPIQIALNSKGSKEVVKFTPQGLYLNMENIIEDAQRRILPKGVQTPLMIQVKNYDLPAVSFEIDGSEMTEMFAEIRKKLTEDKEIVNRYLITTPRRIHGRSVVNYYHCLQIGKGYKTVAHVYGNFNIDMRQTVYKVLCECVPSFPVLFDKAVVATVVDNLEVDEIEKMVNKFDESHQISECAYRDINPAIWDKLSENEKAGQKLHYVFKHYFGMSEKFYMVMNKVARRLSYDNEKIKLVIDSVYMKPISYDATIREMQETFKAIFATEEFEKIIVKELGDAMTDLVNKMFLTI